MFRGWNEIFAEGKRAEATQRLKALGFSEASVARLFEVYRGGAWLGGVWGELIGRLSSASAPERATTRLHDLLLHHALEIGEIPPRRFVDLIVPLLAGSSKAYLHLQRHPDALLRAWRADPSRPLRREAMEAACAPIAAAEDFETLCRALRRYRREIFFRIALRDLSVGADIRETMGELSDLADVLLATAVRGCMRLLGVPVPPVVLALGKLGGRELNFSSDIDLLFLYDASSPEGASPVRRQGIYARLCETVVRALQQPTEEGFCFRVDLDLRPDGRNGPLVNSISAALTYYENWGATWERVALLKARPVAGDLAGGTRALAAFEPFIYRKYLDYTVISDLAEMKGKIERKLAQGRNGFDLKLSRGGIREIEFIVHALQLLHAGRDPSLRGTGTIDTLDRLAQRGILPPADAATLRESYLFLRRLEHRLQIDEEQQTHRLPDSTTEREWLARGLGMSGEEMQRRLSAYTAGVHAIFRELFLPASHAGKEPAAFPSLPRLFEAGGDPTPLREELARAGFSDPAEAMRRIERIGASPPPRDARAKRLMERLLPPLLSRVAESPDPDQALCAMERFMRRIGARSTFYTLLLDHPPLLAALSELFGTSVFLSELLIRHPEVIDSLLLAPLAHSVKTRAELNQECAAFVDDLRGYEERLLALRRYKNLEVLRIGMNDINGALRSEETTEQLTLLAEVCLGKVYDLVCEAVAGRFGPPRFRVGAGGEVRAGSLAILALGRLGQGELSYSSDLDLIFLYDLGEEVPEAEGGCARLSPHAYFTKIAQRMISALSLPSEEGFLYRIDTRLRPSGNAGPLVTSREAFLAYHTQGQARVAQNWEKLALLKARAVAGDRRLGARIVSIVQETLYGMNPDATVLSDLEAMRSRIEKELAREDRSRYNVKTGRGGLVDIEFMVQMLQRSQGGRYAALRTTSIREALRHLSETKYFSSTDQRFLEEAYDFLRRLEHALRIVHDRPIDDLTCLADNLDQIAARMGYRGSRKEGGGSALLARYREVTHGVRRCYEATLRKLRNDLPRGVEEQGMGA